MTQAIKLESFLTRAEALFTPTGRPVLDELTKVESGEHPMAKSGLVLPTLEPGEQYRFHFDMTRCIGCRCCEVACNEQNGNPAEVTWRRVGEVEGGTYPHVRRFHVSMACNHCLEPACLEGCPTESYEKLDNGIVKHHAERCIGCQYCTWNCPYGVPQYNEARRIVTKCHLCVDRIGGGNLPACVEACPVQAIQVEKIKPDEWRQAIASANAPGVPPADLTLSTTRITLPENLPTDFGKVTATKLEPEPAHWSLIYFLTLSQGSTGALLAAIVCMFERTRAADVLVLCAALFGHASLAGATLHLGKPAHAYRALRAFKRSWLSREVVAFSAYAALVSLAAAPAFLRLIMGHEPPFSQLMLPMTILAALSGLSGVYASVRIYRVPARPAWDSARTNAGFFLTAVVLGAALGALTATAFGAPTLLRAGLWLVLGAASLLSALMPFTLVLSGTATEPALAGAAKLLSQWFSRALWLRTALLGSVALVACAQAFGAGAAPLWVVYASLGVCLFAEGLGRYLFFRCVVPRNMPLGFFAQKPGH